MERENTIPAERATRAFTDLGRALEQWNRALGSHSDAVERTSRSIEETNTAAEKKPKDQTTVDPITEQYRSERDKFARQEAEFQQVAAMLGSTIGVGQPGEEGAKASSEAAKLRKEIVDVQEAYDRGLIDLTDTDTALKKLNHNLKLAEGKAALQSGAGGEGGSSRWSKLIQSAVPAVIEGTKKGIEALAGQISGVGSGLMSSLGGALPVAGGLAIFGLMLWGFKEADRMRAEMGEVVNIAVAAGGNAHSRGVAWMAGFQERCQKFYGISRAEVQGVFKNFVDSGVAMDDMFKTIDKGLGEAGVNAIALTVAADRHFELSTGATSKAVSQAVTQYGMELGKAAVLLTDIEFQASHAGFGVGSFVTWTMQASGQVRHLGIGIEEVASAAFSMKQFYAKAGLDSEKFAKDSVGEMLSGLQGMGTGREVWAAEQLGLGQGIEGRQKMKEGLMRRDPMMLRKLAGVLKRDAVKAGGGNEAVSQFYLEKTGYGVEGAKAVMTLGDESEQDAKVHDKKKDDRKALKNSFNEEAQKVSDLKKKMNEMLAGFAKAGQGMIQMLTGFMALVIVSVKGLPYYFMGSKEEADRALAMMQEQLSNISTGAKTFFTGSKEALGAIWKIVEPSMRPLVAAWEFNPHISRLTKEEADAFAEKDPNTRRDRIAGVLGKYDLLAPDVVNKLYGGGEVGDPVVFNLSGVSSPVPMTAKNKGDGTSKTRWSSPASTKPASGDTKPPPSLVIPTGPITIDVGNKPIIVGSLGRTHVIRVSWDGDPDAENLTLRMATTEVVG